MDATRCKKMVYGPGWSSHQCRRKIWKDGYCKQHHPDSVAERDKKSRENYEKRSPWGMLGRATERIKELEAEVERLKKKLEV